MGHKSRNHRFDVAARRARLASRHHLIEPAPSIERVAGDLCGLHSSDPSTVYLSAWARLDDEFLVNDLEVALYVDRSIARMLGMRRTMFVVPLDFAAVMDAACTRALLAGERKRLVKMIEEQIADDGEGWLADVEAKTLAALEARGEAVARELVADVPELSKKLVFGQGKSWGGSVGMSTRVLFLLATAGAIVRGRPRGRWTSSQYQWAPIDRWLPAPLAPMTPRDARADLARRYLASYGPATIIDVQWWSGWTKGQTLDALEDADAITVDIGDGEPGFVLAGDRDVDEPRELDGWVALLPGLDPTVMGWKQRDFYMPAHADQLFDRNGNAGPTVWVDGKIVGGWSQRGSGEVVFELLEKVPAAAITRIEQRAHHLSEWLGEVTVIPRFPSPLDKKLRS